MEEYRSKSYSDGRNWQMEVYGGGRDEDGSGSGSGSGVPPASSYGMRSYSTSTAYQLEQGNEGKVKRGKSSGGPGWGLMNDPELQRRKRVASYKVYSVEGKVKGSFKKSFRWLKDRYTHVVYGWW